CINPVVDLSGAMNTNDNGLIGMSDKNNDPLDASGNFSLSGQDSITLLPGTYFFNTLTLTGGSTISVTDSTTFFIVGDISVSGGGIVNVTQLPSNLAIITTATTVEWGGSSSYFGSIVAPDAALKISGGADLFGAALAGTLEMTGGSDFHVDTSLCLVLNP
ncbi:MAG: hypothetical protein V3T70_04560, partial [Phycisphaerae bacterium]